MRIRKLLISLLAVLAAVLVFFRLAEALHPVNRKLARDTAAPYGRFSHLLPRSVANFFALSSAAFRDQSALMEERDLYRGQTEQLRAEVLLLRQAQAENNELRRELRIAEHEPRLLSAEVLTTRAGDGWMNRLRIDKGTCDGVEPNCAVVTADGLVGRVLSATPHTADVLMLTDASSRLSCTIEGEDAIRGILCGNGIAHHDKNLSLVNLVKPLSVNYLHKDTTLAPGMRVVTSGLGGLYPAGIPIGEILSIEKDASGLFQSAQVVPFVDYAALRRVFVVRDSGRSIRRIDETFAETAAEEDGQKGRKP